MTSESPFDPIEKAVAAVARGEVVIVVDDADRENEGDLIMAAEKVTPEAMGFMIRHTSGVICMPVTGDRLDRLRLPLMVSDNTESQRTAFTVSVDARHGVTTGISAADRSTTVLTVLDPEATPDDLARPGHIFPLRYREGGVLKRAATRRPRSTWPGWPASSRPGCWPRSSTTTAPWPACPSCSASRPSTASRWCRSRT